MRGNTDVVGSGRDGEGDNHNAARGVGGVGCGVSHITCSWVKEGKGERGGGDEPIFQSRLEAAASIVESFLLGDALCVYV